MKTKNQIEEMIDHMNYECAIANEGYGYNSVEEAQEEIKRIQYAINVLKWVIEMA